MQRVDSRAIDLLSQPRRAIVEHLKLHEPMRAEDIARDLNVTVSGIRQHLAALSAEGLVTHDVVRGQPGRPKHAFRLTTRGQELFPRNYARLAADMIEFLDGEDPLLVERMFERRTTDQLDRIAPLLNKRPLRERVRMLAAALDEEGFMTAVDEGQEGVLLLVERNCALLELARIDTRICQCELQLIERALPDAVVTRTAHTLESGPHCVYEIAPRAEDAA